MFAEVYKHHLIGRRRKIARAKKPNHNHIEASSLRLRPRPTVIPDNMSSLRLRRFPAVSQVSASSYTPLSASFRLLSFCICSVMRRPHHKLASRENKGNNSICNGSHCASRSSRGPIASNIRVEWTWLTVFHSSSANAFERRLVHSLPPSQWLGLSPINLYGQRRPHIPSAINIRSLTTSTMPLSSVLVEQVSALPSVLPRLASIPPAYRNSSRPDRTLLPHKGASTLR